MAAPTALISQDLKTHITGEQVAQMVQSDGPDKKRIVEVLAFELMRTGVDPLHSNSGRSLAANLARCYNDGIHRIPDITPNLSKLHSKLVPTESHTPPGSPPVSRLVFSALSSRSSDEMSISGSSLNDDIPNSMNKPLPELPRSCWPMDMDTQNLGSRPATKTPLSRPPTIPEEDTSSTLEESSPSTPKQRDYANIGNDDGEEIEDEFDMTFNDPGVERENTTRHTSLWELKEVLEDLRCEKDYIATLLTSAYTHGKKADLTYVRLKLD
ncbi:hypothetical protein TWF281_006540 [Arthrobotrys megalospora]